MSRLWQVFVAPGEDSSPLPLRPSPWHDGRMVRVPHEHWLVILSFAASMNQALSDELGSISRAPDNNPDDEVSCDLERLSTLISFMQELGIAIQAAPALISEVSDEVVDDLTNDEHARMIDAVACVLKQSNEMRRHFRAWIE